MADFRGTIQRAPSGEYIRGENDGDILIWDASAEEWVSSPIPSSGGVEVSRSDPNGAMPIALPSGGSYQGVFSLGGNVVTGQVIIVQAVAVIANTGGTPAVMQAELTGGGILSDIANFASWEIAASSSIMFPIQWQTVALADGAWTIDIGFRGLAAGFECRATSFAHALIFPP